MNEGLEFQLHFSLFVIIVFLCITLHELGHAFAAKYCKINPIDIIITPLGGGTRFTQSAMKPAQELIITIAGPLMNVLIMGLVMPSRVNLAINMAVKADAGIPNALSNI